MWIASKLGFYSIVQKQPGEWHVRARTKRDLENLVRDLAMSSVAGELANGFASRIHCWPEADYRWRLVITDAEQVAAVFVVLASSVDYPNFKGEIAALPDQQDKLPAYHDLWHGLMRLQR